jgi:hypothetical protein
VAGPFPALLWMPERLFAEDQNLRRVRILKRNGEKAIATFDLQSVFLRNRCGVIRVLKK